MELLGLPVQDAEPICFTAGGTFDPQRLARAFLKIKQAVGPATRSG